MKNRTSYIGISFIVLVFGIWTVKEFRARFKKIDLVEIGPAPKFELINQYGKKINNKGNKCLI